MLQKIADLLDAIGEACDISNDIRNVFLVLRSDANYLNMKDGINPAEWQESYRSVFGCYPTQELFIQHADDAIQKSKEFLVFGNVLASVGPAYKESIQTSEELLRRLQEYRDSIPAYFTSA